MVTWAQDWETVLGFSKADIIGDFNKSIFSEHGGESLVRIGSREIWNKGIKERSQNLCWGVWDSSWRGHENKWDDNGDSDDVGGGGAYGGADGN